MARRFLNAAKPTTFLAAWSDLEDGILDNGSSVVSEDSKHDLLSAGDDDDETNDNMNNLSPVNSPGARTSAEDEISDGSEEDSDSDDSTKSSDAVTIVHLGEEMVRCGLPHVLHHQEYVHVILDTSEKDQSKMLKGIKNEVDTFKCFLDEDMLKQVVKRTTNQARRDVTAKSKNLDERAPVDLCEIRGIVGLLYLFGVYRSQHELFSLVVVIWSNRMGYISCFFRP